nr:immunoglobulin light chain junction region [Macaca mulatta]
DYYCATWHGSASFIF